MSTSKPFFARAPFSAAHVGKWIGVSSGLLSLVLAWMALQLHGNPAFLFIWLTAAMAITAYIRFNHRWLASFERISRQTARSAKQGVRSSWNGEATDVVFKDIPDTPAPLDRLAA